MQAQLCGLRRGDRSTRFSTKAVLFQFSACRQTESKKRTVEWRSPVSFDQRSILADALPLTHSSFER
jgi:hypothetical protein